MARVPSCYSSRNPPGHTDSGPSRRPRWGSALDWRQSEASVLSELVRCYVEVVGCGWSAGLATSDRRMHVWRTGSRVVEEGRCPRRVPFALVVRVDRLYHTREQLPSRSQLMARHTPVVAAVAAAGESVVRMPQLAAKGRPRIDEDDDATCWLGGCGWIVTRASFDNVFSRSAVDRYRLAHDHIRAECHPTWPRESATPREHVTRAWKTRMTWYYREHESTIDTRGARSRSRLRN
jgi:hypothetical protein